MSEEQRLAWERKYQMQGIVWAKAHDEWFKIADGERVLDLGCGSGKSCSSLAGKIVAADFSMSALRMLGSSAPKASPVCCDVTKLPFSDGAFDIVRASFVLGHLEPKERSAAIGEIRRVLRQGGRLALEVFSTSDSRLVMGGKLSRSRSTEDDGISHRYFDEAEVSDILSDFIDVSMSEETWEQRIGPKKTMKRSIIRALATRP